MSIRNSPSVHANDHCMETMRGNDKKLYMSLPDKNMVCRWKKVGDNVINTDELYYKAVESLGPKWHEFKKMKVDKKSSSSVQKSNRKSVRKPKSVQKSRKSLRKPKSVQKSNRKSVRKPKSVQKSNRKSVRKLRLKSKSN
jgi:hypothetical protein